MEPEIIGQLAALGGAIIVGIMTIIQLLPVKVSPWSAIAKFIGKAINSEVLEKVDQLSKDVKQNKDDDDAQWASLSRSHILRFGDELLHGTMHSKEHFDQILSDIAKYEQYCKTHPDYLNGIANATIQQIKKTYQKCLEENSFL